MPPKATAKGKAKSKGKAKAKAKPAASPSETPVPAEAEEEEVVEAIVQDFEALQGQKEADIEEAVRAAEAAALRMERRRMEEEARKFAEKKAKAKKLAADTQKLLTAAFDGELAQVKTLLDTVGLPLSSKDANGTTALSEAASGGVVECVELLLERRSDPNSRGEFQRTPLWRAAYAGHLEVVNVLLEGGGDPRLYNDDGQTPVDVATKDEILAALRDWDVSRTDELVDDFDSWAEDIRLADDFRKMQAMREVDAEYEGALKAHEVAQAALARAKVAMRARVKEHGVGLAAGHETARLACMSADSEVQKAEAEADAAQTRFDAANLKRMAKAEECGANSEQLGRQVLVADLNAVLLRDLGDRIRKSKKWPLVQDTSDCARKLLQYAGCSVLNFWRAEEMDPNKIRLALLSMIRGGGAFAIDLACFGAGVDETLLAEPLNSVRPWLFSSLVARDDSGKCQLLTPEGKQVWPRFIDMVDKDEKKKGYGLENFDEERSVKFKFVVLTSAAKPHKDLVRLFDVLQVSCS